MKKRTNQRGFTFMMFAVLVTGLGVFGISFSNVGDGNGSTDQYSSSVQHQKSVVTKIGQLLLNDRQAWESESDIIGHDDNPLADGDNIYISDRKSSDSINYKNFLICFDCTLSDDEKTAFIENCDTNSAPQDKEVACIDGKKLQMEGINIVRNEMQKIANRARFMHTAMKQSSNKDCNDNCNYFQEMEACGFDVSCATVLATSDLGKIDGTHLIVNEFDTWNSSDAQDVKFNYQINNVNGIDSMDLTANGPLGTQIVEVIAVAS